MTHCVVLCRNNWSREVLSLKKKKKGNRERERERKKDGSRRGGSPARETRFEHDRIGELPAVRVQCKTHDEPACVPLTGVNDDFNRGKSYFQQSPPVSLLLAVVLTLSSHPRESRTQICVERPAPVFIFQSVVFLRFGDGLKGQRGLPSVTLRWVHVDRATFPYRNIDCVNIERGRFFFYLSRDIFCNIEQTSTWPRVFLVSKKSTGMDDRCEGINGYEEGEKRRKGKDWTARYLNSRDIRRASNPKRDKRVYFPKIVCETYICYR